MAVYLFGSVEQGEERADSDLDDAALLAEIRAKLASIDARHWKRQRGVSWITLRCSTIVGGLIHIWAVSASMNMRESTSRCHWQHDCFRCVYFCPTTTQ